MTDADLKAMTLGDLEALASRFEAAVKIIREAQSLLGGTPQAAPRIAPQLSEAQREALAEEHARLGGRPTFTKADEDALADLRNS